MSVPPQELLVWLEQQDTAYIAFLCIAIVVLLAVPALFLMST